MFGAMVVLLQGQATPGLHDQPFGLESIAAIDPLIGAPRAKHFRGAHRGFVASLAKELDRRLHILGPAKVGNENGVRGDDHGQSLETNRDNQPFLFGAKKALLLSSATTGPRTTFPCSSFSEISQRDDHDPTSDHPMSTGRTKAFAVFSMTATSIEMPTSEAKVSLPERTNKPSRLKPRLASATALATCGACRASSSRMTLARNRNMPLFQRNRPSSK